MMPQLSAEGIHLVRPEEMSGEQDDFSKNIFTALCIRSSRRLPSIPDIRFPT
jgi:hypothetical protein